MSDQHRLKSNHQKLYEFLDTYGVARRLLSKQSPKPLRTWRILIFILYICLGTAFVVTMHLKASPWNLISGIAVLTDAVFMIWIYRKTLKLIQQGFHSIIFKKRFELEQYAKNELVLSKKAIEATADICFNLSERYKRNYYRLELPLSLLAVAVTVFAVAKDATLENVASLAFLSGIVLFALWYLLANFATSLDQRSSRYFELYLLLNDMEHNKQYKRLKKEHLERLRDEETEMV
jgi:Ca2+/Na+ antiporter